MNGKHIRTGDKQQIPLVFRELNWALLITTLFVLVVCCFFSVYKAAGIVAFLTLAFYALATIFRNPLIVIKFLPVFFACATNVLGLATIEFLPSTILPELKQYSYFNGSMPLLCLGWWCFLTVIVLFDRNKTSHSHAEKKESGVEIDWLLIFTSVELIVCLVMFLHVIEHPSFIEGVDRFKYDAAYIGGIWKKIDGLLKPLMIIPMMATRKKHKVLGFTTLGVFCVYLFWTGTKFGDFFDLFIMFLLVYFIEFEKMSKKVLRKWLVALGVSVIFFVGLAGFAYTFTSSKPLNEFYSDRLSQQGQLWWKVYFAADGETHVDEFVENELPALTANKQISECVGDQNGIYKAMYLSAPTSVVDNKLKSGSRYSSAGFACAYYYFGPAGVVVFGVLMGFLYLTIINALLKAINMSHFITAVIFVRFYSFARNASGMFLFSQFLTIPTLVCYAYLIVAAIYRHGTRFAPINRIHELADSARAKMPSFLLTK